MTLIQLEAIYKANLNVGHLEGLEAVFLNGYYAGTGGAVPKPASGILTTITNPSTTVKFTVPDLR